MIHETNRDLDDENFLFYFWLNPIFMNEREKYHATVNITSIII